MLLKLYKLYSININIFINYNWKQSELKILFFYFTCFSSSPLPLSYFFIFLLNYFIIIILNIKFSVLILNTSNFADTVSNHLFCGHQILRSLVIPSQISSGTNYTKTQSGHKLLNFLILLISPKY